MPSESLLPPALGALVFVALLAAAGWGLWRYRGVRLRRAWKRCAARLEGSLEADGPRLRARGRYRGHAAFLQEAVSHEDAIPYPHTRGSLNVRNPANVVAGLRHKSLLEEVTTRRDARPVETGDAEFDRAFFLHLNTPEHVAALLSADGRRALLRRSDVEVYVRSGQVEWRRSGTLADATEMMALFDVIADIADALVALPPRPVSLSEKLADEAAIENGV